MRISNLVQKFKNKKFLRNNRGQGIIEYVLLAVVVLALVGIFRDRIKTALQGRTEALGNEITDFSAE